jgi:hypothetical protein
VSQQGLLFKETRLESDRTVGKFGITKGSTVDLLAPSSTIQINVKTPSGKVVPLNVDSGHSIKIVKGKIKEKEGVGDL